MKTAKASWSKASLRKRLGVGTLLGSILMVCAIASAQPAGPPGGPPPAAGGNEAPGEPPVVGGGAFLRKPIPPNAPAPSSDPRNLDGVWIHKSPLELQIRRDMYGNALPFNTAGRKVMDRRLKAMKDGVAFINASSKCFPAGPPWQMDLGMPWQIFQSKDRLDIVFEEYHGAIQIFLDPAKAPSEPSYMGRSIGHWDGDTLVVETTGFKDGLYLEPNGTPVSKNAKLTQRIRKTKGANWFLEVVYTLEDPTYYTNPWSWVRDYQWRPDGALFLEYDCEMQTGRKGGIDSSLVPEPQD